VGLFIEGCKMKTICGFLIFISILIFNSCRLYVVPEEADPELIVNGDLEEIDSAKNFPVSWMPWMWDTRVSVDDQVFHDESGSGNGHSIHFYTEQMSAVGELCLIQEISPSDIVFGSEYLLSFYSKNEIMHETQYGFVMIRSTTGSYDAAHSMQIDGSIQETDWRLISSSFVFQENTAASQYEIVISFQNDITGHPDPVVADDPLSIWVDDISLKLAE